MGMETADVVSGAWAAAAQNWQDLSGAPAGGRPLASGMVMTIPGPISMELMSIDMSMEGAGAAICACMVMDLVTAKQNSATASKAAAWAVR